MSPEEFDRAAARLPRMTAGVRAAARAVLVDGAGFTDAGAPHGVTRQAAYVAAHRVFHLAHPSGWEARLVVLPPQQMRQVLAMERAARREWADALPPLTRGRGSS